MEGVESASSHDESIAPQLRLQKTSLSENEDEKGDKYWCIFGGEQFAEGNVRRVYRGVYLGDGPKYGQQCLVKIFKESKAKELKDIAPDLAVSLKAAELAEEFNEVMKISKCTDPFRPISVEVPLICKVSTPVVREDLRRPDVHQAIQLLLQATDQIDLKKKLLKLFDHEHAELIPEYVAVEQFLEGKWYKFNSNCGHEDQNKSLVMPAFGHWTWQYSDHQLNLCDLQGVKRRDKYLLTDPAIHSLDGNTYGSTDLGIGGMARVMQFHECNFICKRLKLENIFADESLPRLTGAACTSHRFTVGELSKEVEREFREALPSVRE